jgi:hypothetical protein
MGKSLHYLHLGGCKRDSAPSCGRCQVSTNRVIIGDLVWSRDGKHLLAKNVNRALIVADVQSQGGEFHAGVIATDLLPARGSERL